MRDIADLNNASVENLEKIEGIGRKRAEEIVRYRDQNGGFKSWGDVRGTPGFSDEMVHVLQSDGSEWGA